MTTRSATTPADYPAVGATVEHQTEAGASATRYEVAGYEDVAADGSVIATLTRRAVAPGTSMDRIMGNGRCPDYGIATKRIVLRADGTCESLGDESFTRD